MNKRLHFAQFRALDHLRRKSVASFSELMHTTDLPSDSYKHHVSELVSKGFIEKDLDGRYRLTAAGKEYANQLDDQDRTPYRHIKSSMVIVVSRTTDDGSKKFLTQRRQREPFARFWGFLSGPIPWGVTVESAAAAELAKQAGVSAELKVVGFLRQTDTDQSGDVLEDKLFTIITGAATSINDEHEWSGGHNDWLSLEELTQKDRLFDNTTTVIDMMSQGDMYRHNQTAYSTDQY